jgi:hypothetical protein
MKQIGTDLALIKILKENNASVRCQNDRHEFFNGRQWKCYGSVGF